jgi:hypothetical protein
LNFISKSINTNKNNTVIALTYTIKSIKAKYSQSSNNNTNEANIKLRTKSNNEKTIFADFSIKSEVIIIKIIKQIIKESLIILN